MTRAQPRPWLLTCAWLLACSGPPEQVGRGESSSGATGQPMPDPPSPTTGLSSSSSSQDPTTDATSSETADTTTTTATSTDTTTVTSSSVCGDGVVDDAEQCDLGDLLNSDAGECTLACSSARCGDGLVWAGHEECDDGSNNNDTLHGACTTACVWGARCNDGVVHPPFEECDLGDLNNTGMSPEGGVPCTACRFEARLVFLGSKTFTGAQLGGLSGADLRCQQMAAAFDNAPAFRAWLSSAQGSPHTRFDHGPATTGLPYVLPNGRRLADDYDDLIAHGPDDGISVTELGTELLDVRVWTNTDASGQVFDPDLDCDGWTSDSVLQKSRVGRSGVDTIDTAEWTAWKTERQWTSYMSFDCKKPRYIYCFEQ